MKHDPARLRAKLNEVLDNYSITVIDLADKLGVSENYIHKIRGGLRRGTPRLMVRLVKVAAKLAEDPLYDPDVDKPCCLICEAPEHEARGLCRPCYVNFQYRRKTRGMELEEYIEWRRVTPRDPRGKHRAVR